MVKKFTKLDLINLKDDELIQRAINLRDGVPFATPVFDGAKELDINELFEVAKSDTSGQKTLLMEELGTTLIEKLQSVKFTC